MKNKKIRSAFLVCLAVAVTVIAGYSYGMEHRDPDAEILSDMADAVETDAPDDLMVVDSTELYPAFTLRDLAAYSSNIVIAEVLEIGETTAKHDWYDDLELEEGIICIQPLQTAVTLEVKESIKGAAAGEKIIFYQDGGVTPEYRQRTNGYELEKGMKLLLFLGEEGTSFGGQGEFLVFDDAVKIPMFSDVLDYLDAEKIYTVQTQSLESVRRDRIRSESLHMMKKDDFKEAIRLLLD